MRTAAYKEDVASDRRRHQNVPWHILFDLNSIFNNIKVICF